MAVYDVIVVETYRKAIRVEADSDSEAEKVAEEKWAKGDISMALEDIASLEFRPVRRRDKHVRN